jgi:hypothetical protein
MTRSIFGWDYPPGCNSVPGDEENPDNTDPYDIWRPKYESLRAELVEAKRLLKIVADLGQDIGGYVEVFDEIDAFLKDSSK